MASVTNRLFWLTPIGRADKQTRKHLEGKNPGSEQLEEYQEAVNKYRAYKALHNLVKIFLYAGIITSIATTFGFEQVQIILQIASYIGLTLLLFMYWITLHLSEIHREELHLKREIMISNVSEK